MENLEKIDLIRERLGVTYEEAYLALEKVDGDVIAALVKLEKEKSEAGSGNKRDRTKPFGLNSETLHVKGQELVDKIKELIKEGNINKIIIKNDEKTVLEIPVTAGVVSLVLFPYLTLLGGLAAMYKDYTLEIDKEEKKTKSPSTEPYEPEEL